MEYTGFQIPPLSVDYVFDNFTYTVSDEMIGIVSLSFQTIRMEISNTNN
jgi:hypothetical protein